MLFARDAGANSVKVSWVLTEDGSDTVTTGNFLVPTEKLVSAADLFKSVFFDQN